MKKAFAIMIGVLSGACFLTCLAWLGDWLYEEPFNKWVLANFYGRLTDFTHCERRIDYFLQGLEIYAFAVIHFVFCALAFTIVDTEDSR